MASQEDAPGNLDAAAWTPAISAPAYLAPTRPAPWNLRSAGTHQQPQGLESHETTGFISAKGVVTDHLQAKMLRDVENFRMESFDGFEKCESRFTIYPTSPAKAIKDQDGEWVGFNEYHFEGWGRETATMALRINSKGDVCVNIEGKWRRFRKYLEGLSPPSSTQYAQSARDKQEAQAATMRAYWCETGLKFRFFDIPAEIRELIYGFAFGGAIDPYPTRNPPNFDARTDLMYMLFPRQPNLTFFLHTSSQIYREGSGVLYNRNPFVVQRRQVLSRLLKNQAQRSRIRRLQLAFCHSDYGRLFRHNHDHEPREQVSASAVALRHMELSRLEITIAPPSTFGQDEWPRGVCQKAVVNEILRLAWPWVRGHPVHISGYVTSEQKRIFEAACAVEHKRYDLWRKQRKGLLSEESRLSNYDEIFDTPGEDGGVALTAGAQAERESVELVEEEFEKLMVPVASLDCACEDQCSTQQWVWQE